MERALQGCLSPSQTSTPEPRPRSESAPDTSKQGKDAQGPYTLKRDAIGWYKARPPHIAVISAAAFRKTCRRKNGRHAVVTGITTLHEIDRILELKMVLEDDDDQLRRQALEQVPKCYHDYLDVFSKAESDMLP
ncbi:hypothetical protein N657DRAFT_584456, partial [Parathielavia appendiculata]